MTVPFPRTTPDDAPDAPERPVDWRAARAVFEHRRNELADATAAVVGYRASADGVVVTHDDGSEIVIAWVEAEAIALGQTGTGEPEPPSRRDKRQQRRADRRDR